MHITVLGGESKTEVQGKSIAKMAKEPSSATKTSSAGKEGKAGSASKDGKKDSTVASPSSTPTKSSSVSSKASTPDSKKSTPPSSASPEKGKKEEAAKPKSASGKKEEKEAKKAENGEKKEEVVKVSGDSKGKEAESGADTKAENDPLLAEPSVPVRLTYFDGAGRAELIRLVLAVGKMDYEDRRIGSEQWARIKTGGEKKESSVVKVLSFNYYFPSRSKLSQF